MQLQPRDLEILAALGEHGLLDSAVIAARFWPTVGSPRACQERLRLISEAKLIRKTQLLVAKDGSGGGRLPAVYVLTPHGAEVLTLETGEVPLRVARSDPSPATLLHRLEMIHTRLAVDDACRREQVPAPAWIYEQDTKPGTKLSDSLESRHLLYERIRWNGRDVTCRPDASCLLRYAGPKTLILYWEFDRSTNSLSRESDKAAGYEALIGARRFGNHWPQAGDHPIVRVFYVCPSSERIANVAAQIAREPIAAYYRFAEHGKLSAASVLTQPIWSDVARRQYTILNAANRVADKGSGDDKAYG